MRIFSTLRGIAVASVGVLSLVGCDALRIDQGVVNTDDPAAFKCSDNDDCLTGYKCLKNVGTEYSVCTAQGTGLNCEQYNLDGDLYLAEDPIPPEGCFGLRGDCDDTDPNTYPGAPEVCDGKDNSCNGEIDDGLESMLCPKQLGVCRGARTACVAAEVEACDEPVTGGDSIYQTNAAANDSIYSEVELCDGTDNNCDGRIDEGCCSLELPLTGQGAGTNVGCNCVEGQAFACGADTGTCSRGVRFCDAGNVPGADLPCLDVAPEATLRICNPDTDVWVDGSDEFCVTERIGVMEDLNDDCQNSDDPGCVRSVWRKLATVDTQVTCESDSECTGSREICAFDNVCRKKNVTPIKETCNGLDDDCNGSVDNQWGSAATAACGECPFNMVKTEVLLPNNRVAHTCVDIYEASRSDATASDAGALDTHAVSVQGALPWTGVNAVQAKDACEAVELRDLVGGTEGSTNRTRVVPFKTLCEPYSWGQACGGERAQSTSWKTSIPNYPYGAQHAAAMCNDSGEAGAMLPTGDMADCWTKDGGYPSADFIECTETGGCKVTPVDMIGNAMEWTVNQSGLNNPDVNSTTQVFLAGGSFKEGADMTCQPSSAYTQPAGSNRTNAAVRTEKGRASCTSDADCVTGDKCEGSPKMCVTPCTETADCNGRGICDTILGTVKACLMPNSVVGDYSAFDDVGFRCCASPLQ